MATNSANPSSVAVRCIIGGAGGKSLEFSFAQAVALQPESSTSAVCIMQRTTRSAAREQRTARLRGLLLGDHGFSSEFFRLVFERLGLGQLYKVANVCKFLHDAKEELEAAWEVLVNPPLRVDGLQQPQCAMALPDPKVSGRLPRIAVGNWGHGSSTQKRTNGIDLLWLQFDDVQVGGASRKGVVPQVGDAPKTCDIVDALASDGAHIFVCDRNNERVQKLTLECAFVACHHMPDKQTTGICWCPGKGATGAAAGSGASASPGRLFVSVDRYTEPGTGYVLILDAGSMAPVGEFGRGHLDSPQQITEDRGLLYVVDTREHTAERNGCVMVFALTGDYVRRIELTCCADDNMSRPGRPARLVPSGVAIAYGHLIVAGNKWVEAEDTGWPWDQIVHFNNPRTHEGELQVLTLEGSLRQAIVRPGAMEFGAIDVRIGSEGDAVLLVTDRGSFPGGAQEPRGSLFVFPLRHC